MELFENIEKQLTEIEILRSIYSNSNEFTIEDEEAFADATELVEKGYKETCTLNKGLAFVLRFSIFKSIEENENKNNEIPVEIALRLPLDYPLKSHPEVLVRCSKVNLNRNFYLSLKKFISEIHTNDSSVLTIIEWIKENFLEFIDTKNEQNNSNNGKGGKNKSDTISRAWIYLHHIYSSDKRQKLITWAKELDLNGFSMPGKPGMICIEGSEANVQDFITRAKQIPWQKIQVKDIQSFKVENVNTAKKFEPFEEKLFLVENQGKEPTRDLGLLFNYLNEKGFASVFNLFFGVSGTVTANKIT